MSKYCSMKCAKPDEKDFDKFSKLMVLENLFDGRYWSSHEDEWREWDDDDEDKKELLDCEKWVRDFYGLSETDDMDNDIILCEYVRRLFKGNSSVFRRVEMAAMMAIDNCFDPDIDYIDWKPEIKNAIAFYNENKEFVDNWVKKNVLPEEEEDCRVYTINDVYCKNHGYVKDGDEYTLDTDECTITYNFEKMAMTISLKCEEEKSVTTHKERLTLFDLRENLRMFKCQKTLDLVGTDL